MEYFKVTSDYIYYLKSNLAIFKNDVLYEINRQERDEIESAKREASEDKSYARYEEKSIDDWLSARITYFEDWARDMRNELNADYSRALSVIDELKDKRFYESDLGTEFEVSLYDGTITKASYDEETVYITIQGITWSVDGVEFDFTPNDPDFTDWIEE